MVRVTLNLLPRRVLMGLVRGYRYGLSPWLGNACRFEPSCSAYALQALQAHGAARGTALTVGRLLRCQPWCAAGHDPVPETFRAPGAGLFTRLFRPAETSAGSEPNPPIRKFP